MWGYVGLYGVMWGYVGLCGVMWGYVGLCGVMWGYVGLCGVMWGHAGSWCSGPYAYDFPMSHKDILDQNSHPGKIVWVMC